MTELTDSKRPEFQSWDTYRKFARDVRHKRRFVRTEEAEAFLAAVRATHHKRLIELPKGMELFRAQRGVDWRSIEDKDGNQLGEEPCGYSAARMKPRPNQSTEGRANPAGIAVLYLATTQDTAISEVRPWVGASVSVAQIRLVRSLKTIDLTQGHGRSASNVVGLSSIIYGKPVNAENVESAVWVDIDNAFSRPVTASEDGADYVPTQILSELFRDCGYEAMVYKSHFVKDGFNVVIFDPNDADIVNCAPFEVNKIQIDSNQIGNYWYSKDQK